MDWGAYEIFSVLTGLSLLAVAAVARADTSTRAWMIGGGLFFAGYGWYVATQTTGTWTFPIWIFVVPFVAVGYVAVQLYRRADGAAEPETAPARRTCVRRGCSRERVLTLDPVCGSCGTATVHPV